MKYIVLLSVISSATAAVINIPLTGNAPAPIKLKENQIVNIRATADLSPENLNSPSIVIEVTEKDDNSPIQVEAKGVAGATKIDIVDDSFDEEREIELVPVDQLSPDGQTTLSRSILDKLITFLFGDDSDDGMIPDGFSLSIGIGGKKRKTHPGEVKDKEREDDKNNGKGVNDSKKGTESNLTSAPRPRNTRPTAQEPETGVKDNVAIPAPAPAPEVPAPPAVPEKADDEKEPAPEKAPKPVPDEAPKNEDKPSEKDDDDEDEDEDENKDKDKDDDDKNKDEDDEDEDVKLFDKEQIMRPQVL